MAKTIAKTFWQEQYIYMHVCPDTISKYRFPTCRQHCFWLISLQRCSLLGIFLNISIYTTGSFIAHDRSFCKAMPTAWWICHCPHLQDQSSCHEWLPSRAIITQVIDNFYSRCVRIVHGRVTFSLEICLIPLSALEAWRILWIYCISFQ